MGPCPTCSQRSSPSMSQHQGAMEEYNGISVTSRKPVIFSMDVAAMFPLLKHREVAMICKEQFLKADLKVGVDVIVLYLAIQYQDRRKEIEDLGLDRVVPKRIHPKAKKVLITSEEILEPGAKTVSKFHHVETVATMEQERLDFLNEQFGFFHFKNWIISK